MGATSGKMKQGKSAGPTGVVAGMLEAAGETLYIVDERCVKCCGKG